MISVAVIHSHRLGLHEAARLVLARLSGLLTFGGLVRIAVMVSRALVTEIVQSQAIGSMIAVLASMVRAAAQHRMRGEYEARYAMVESLHRK